MRFPSCKQFLLCYPTVKWTQSAAEREWEKYPGALSYLQMFATDNKCAKDFVFLNRYSQKSWPFTWQLFPLEYKWCGPISCSLSSSISPKLILPGSRNITFIRAQVQYSAKKIRDNISKCSWCTKGTIYTLLFKLSQSIRYINHFKMLKVKIQQRKYSISARMRFSFP